MCGFLQVFLRNSIRKLDLRLEINQNLCLEATECSTISMTMEYGYSFPKVKEVSNYMIKTVSSWLRRGAFTVGRTVLRTLCAFTVRASTKESFISISAALRQGRPALLSSPHLWCFLYCSKGGYSASPRHIRFYI